MKVLIFMTQFYRLSGAERLAVELAEELNKRGIHTDILSMYTEDLPGVAEAKQDLLAKGIPNVYFLGMKIHPPVRSLFPAIFKLRCLIQEQQYDIIETSMLSPCAIASWATLIGHTRHVSGLHRVFRRDRENRIQHKFWRFSVRCNPRNRYYGISNYVSDAWTSYSNIQDRYERTIFNAIPDDCFIVSPDRQKVHREFDIPDDGRIILYVGRLAKCKGCDILLNALAGLLKQYNLYILFAGLLDPMVSGSEEMLDAMQKQLKNEKWGYRVKFIGYRLDVPRLMASADLLVHPTLTEGFGLILVEAMATGLQVVATNVEGIPEVLAGTDSIMVPPNDAHELRNAVLETLHRSPSEIVQAVQKGRRRAENFRICNRINNMTLLFRNVIEGKF